MAWRSNGACIRWRSTGRRRASRTTTSGRRSSARSSSGADPSALPLGTDRRDLASLWEGLECFAAYGDDVEPAPLAAAATDALGRAPDASGLVDHDRIGAAWEQAVGKVSIMTMLFDELTPPGEQARASSRLTG